MLKFKIKIDYFSYLWLILFSVILTLIFSVSTSILYPTCYEDIGNTFSPTHMIIGKGWTEGIIPYKELFGTEGPVFYLLQALGWSIGKRTGLMFLIIIEMIIVTISFYELTRLYLGILAANLLTSVSMIVIAAGNGLNNCPQLFLLAISLCLLTWFFKKYTIMKNNVLTIKESIVLGILFAIALLTKLQAGFWIYTVIIFLFVKQYQEGKKSFVQNICGILIGNLLIFFPFIFYFALNYALYEFLEGTFLFNFQLMLEGFGSANELIRKVIKCIPSLMVLILEFYQVQIKRKEKKSGIWILAVVLSCIFLVSGLGYWNYYILLCPFLIYTASQRNELETRKKCIPLLLSTLCIITIFLIPLKNNLVTLKENIISEEYQLKNKRAYEWNTDYIKSEQTFLGVDIPASYYLIVDQMPTFRLFADQTWLSRVNQKYSSELLNYIYTDPVDWILIDCKGLMNEWYGHYKIQNFFTLYDITAVYALNLEEESEDPNIY